MDASVLSRRNEMCPARPARPARSRARARGTGAVVALLAAALASAATAQVPPGAPYAGRTVTANAVW